MCQANKGSSSYVTYLSVRWRRLHLELEKNIKYSNFGSVKLIVVCVLPSCFISYCIVLYSIVAKMSTPQRKTSTQTLDFISQSVSSAWSIYWCWKFGYSDVRNSAWTWVVLTYIVDSAYKWYLISLLSRKGCFTNTNNCFSFIVRLDRMQKVLACIR